MRSAKPRYFAQFIQLFERNGNQGYYRLSSVAGPGEILDEFLHNRPGAIVILCSRRCRQTHVVMYEKRGRSFRAIEGETLTSATWKLQGEELYVKVECEDDRGRAAWSNPIFYNPEFLWYLNNDYLM